MIASMAAIAGWDGTGGASLSGFATSLGKIGHAFSVGSEVGRATR